MEQLVENSNSEINTEIENDKETEKCDFTAEDLKFENFDWQTKYSDEYYEAYINAYKKNEKPRRFYRFIKRSFDIVAALLGIILASPIMLIIAIAIKLDSKGPVIFKQQRMGKGAKPFNFYKFRSMKTSAPRDCATSELAKPEMHITKVGRILRKLSLDEIPQFFNVLNGTMSFIGYRPLVLTEANCNNMRERMHVFDMRPGISGYAQVVGRDDVYYKNKAILDSEYVKRASLGFDIKLVFETVWVVFKRKGNDSEKQGKSE